MDFIAVDILIIFHSAFWIALVGGNLIMPINWVKVISLIIVPITYLIHAMFPFHILEQSKLNLLSEEQVKEREMAFLVSGLFETASQQFQKHSYANPLSAQGLLILTEIIGAYRLYSKLEQ